ncbi:transcriptional regulator [Alteromonadaceae bacterium Bs31]|nr:transcriptional regulator [Alteromonadaceae bacterium Bs31]
MKFSLKQLQVFQKVAEYKSVSDAAKSLHISQAAASMALHQLETLLDNSLFVRQGRSMELTAWGQWLRPRVHELMATCNTIDMGINSMELVSGVLTIGASQTPAEHLVPGLFSALDQSFPALRLNFAVENTEHVISGLLDYHYDLGIIEGHSDHEKISREIWCKDELVVFASSRHPYSQLQKVSLSQLEMARWILRERGAGTREIFDLCIHEYIDQINVHREYDSIAVIIDMVRAGDYLGCLSYRSLQAWEEKNELSILNVPELSMKRDIAFIWRKDDTENLARDAVLNVAKKLIN